MRSGGWALMALGMLTLLPFAGCKSLGGEPVKCVCNCDGPPPEGAIVKVNEAPAAAPVAPAVAAAPTPAPAAAPARTERPAPGPARATGQVGAEPGSGTPTQLTDDDKTQITKAVTEFANAAGARNLAGMKQWTTQRLGGSLDDAVAKHTERLYRRTDMLTKGVQSGVTIGNTNDTGDGNVDVQLKFSSGDQANLLFFKEDGKWLINRL